jgi:hypothetical protein
VALSRTTAKKKRKGKLVALTAGRKGGNALFSFTVHETRRQTRGGFFVPPLGFLCSLEYERKRCSITKKGLRGKEEEEGRKPLSLSHSLLPPPLPSLPAAACGTLPLV